MVGKARPAVPIIMGNPIFWENSRKMFLVFFPECRGQDLGKPPVKKKIKFFIKFLKRHIFNSQKTVDG